jgi:hypothetical protein
MNLPEKTNAIFERLSKGQFICSNSTDQTICRLYDIINENEDILYDYFTIIDFELERANEYFYFSRIEFKADIQNKIEKAEKWIDLIDFLKTYDHSFTSGYRFYPIDIQLKIRVDLNLRDKLDHLKRHFTGDNKSYEDKINSLLKILEKDGLIELENSISNQYKVVAAFEYIEQLIISINIPEDTQNEISE